MAEEPIVQEGQYVVDEEHLATFYDNIVGTGNVNASQMGSKDEFVSTMKKEGELLKFRQTLLDRGIFNTNQLGDDPAEFYHSFVKKKDQLSQEPIGTGEKEKKEERLLSDEYPKLSDQDVDDFWTEVDAQQLDYQNQTTDDDVDEIATRVDNTRINSTTDPVEVARINREETKVMNDVTNSIIENRDQAFSYHRDNGGMSEYFEHTIKGLNDMYNPDNSKTRKRNIEKAVYEAHKEPVLNDIMSQVSDRGYSKYDVLVNNPKVLDEIKEGYTQKGMPSKVYDLALNDYRSDFDAIVRENEMKVVADKIANYVGGGYTLEKATEMATDEIHKESRNRILESMDRKTRKRLELLTTREKLMNDPNTDPEVLRQVEAEIAGLGDSLYDDLGRRIGSTGSKEQDLREQEINEEIDNISELPMFQTNKDNFKDNLKSLMSQRYLVLRNLERRYEDNRKEMGVIRDAIRLHTVEAGMDKVALDMQNARMDYFDQLVAKDEHLGALVRNANIEYEAVARMHTFNEHPATKRKFMTGYYLEEGVDVIKDLNPFIFGDATNNHSTRAQRVEAFQGAMNELGEELTKEELDRVDRDYLLDLTRQGFAMTDFVIKMAAVNYLSRGLGVDAAIARLANTQKAVLRSRAIRKGFKGAKAYVSRSAGTLASDILGAGLEGVKMGVASGDMKEGFVTGALFYGMNRMLPNIKIKDPKLNTIMNTMYKASAGMTIAMEGTAAFHAAVNAYANNDNVKAVLHEMYGGDVPELVRRLSLEMAVGTIFGIPGLAKAKRAGLFKESPNQIEDTFLLALERNKLGVASDVSNHKFSLLDQNEAKVRANDLTKKLEFIKKNIVDPEEYKGLSDKQGLVPDKIDALFEKLVNEVAANKEIDARELWAETLGKESFEALEQKRLVLEDIGVKGVKKYTPGDVETVYEKMKLDKEYAVRIREKRLQREIERREETKYERFKAEQDAAKNEVGTDRGRAISTEKNAKTIENNPKKDISRVVRQHVSETKRIEKDVASTRIKGKLERYKKIIRKQLTKTSRGLLNDVEENLRLATIQAARSSVPRSDKKYAQLIRALGTVQKALEKNKPLTATQAERLSRSIESGLGLFTPENVTERIKSQIEKYVKKSSEAGHKIERRIDPKTDFIIKALDAIVSGDAEKISKLSGNIESAMEAMIKDRELYDPRAIDRYEAVKNVMKNSETREQAMARRADLHLESLKRNLTNAEQLEYDLLNFRDVESMTLGELIRADAELNNFINNGSNIKQTINTRKVLEKRSNIAVAQKTLSPKRYLSKEAIKEANASMTDTKKINWLKKIGWNEKDIAKLKDSKGKYDREKISLEYEKAVREHYKRSEQMRKSQFRRWLRGTRLWVESFPTMMEMLSINMPGRNPWEGFFHSFSDDMLMARTGKQNEVGYWAREQMYKLKEIFPDSKKAEKAMKVWGKKKHDFYIERGDTGVFIPEEMTVQQALTLYQYAKQKDLEPTFVENGWELYGKNNTKGRSLISLENQIIEHGGKEALEWADWMITDLYPRIYHRLNEKFREHKGTDLEYIVNYSPVFRKGGEGEVSQRVLLDMPVEDYIASAMTSATKSRTENTHWFDLKNVNDNMNAHVERVAQYIHFQDVVSRMEGTFGDAKVREIIASEFGNNANKILDKFRKDVSQDIFTGDRWKSLDKLRANFVKAKLGFNLLLFPKQMMSVNAYQSEIAAEDWAEFTAYLFAPDFKLMKQMSKTEYFKARYAHSTFNRDLALQEQRFGTELARQSMDRAKMLRGHNIADALNPFGGHLGDNMLLMTKLGDGGAILYGGQAMYRVQKNRYKKEGYTEKEAADRAFNDFVRGTRKTQQSGVTEDLSHLQRFGSWGKMLTLFQNTPMQYLRIELAAMDAIATGVRDKDKRKFISGVKDFMMYHFILPATFHAASNGFYIDDILDPDKGYDASWWEDSAVRGGWIVGGLQYAPILGGALMTATSLMNTGFSYSGGVGILSDLLGEEEDFLKFMTELIQGEAEITADQVVKATAAFSTLAGVPATSLYNIEEGIRDFVGGYTHDIRALFGYSEAMRGKYLRSPDYDLIHKHLPVYGGNLSDLLHEVADKEGIRYLDKNKERLSREYMLYSQFGGWDSHVNFLYSTLSQSENKAEYIYDLYKMSVEGKRPYARRNKTLKQGMSPEELTEAEFMQRVALWNGLGVISDEVVEMFAAKKIGKFKEIYKF